jgi:hypothetical protein
VSRTRAPQQLCSTPRGVAVCKHSNISVVQVMAGRITPYCQERFRRIIWARVRVSRVGASGRSLQKSRRLWPIL